MSGSLLEAIRPHLNVDKTASDGRLVCWCPFHADGEGTPPHEPNLYVSDKGYICHACNAKGSLPKLAEHFRVELPDQPETLAAAYDYTDENGELLFQVVRKPGKKFRQRRPDGEGGWIWDLQGVRRAPYRLPDLVSRPDELVYIVEGEKDVDRLLKLGLLATTNSGGAGKWKKEHSAFLKSRDVIILPDNDEPGRKHGEAVGDSLHGTAGSVRILELPDLPVKGDVSDWLDAGHSADELAALAEEAPTLESDPSEAQKEDKADGGGSKSDSLAQQIVELAQESGVELFHDDREEPCARIKTKNGLRTIGVNSKTFRRALAAIAWKELGKAPGGEALTSAATTLGAIACLEREQHRLCVRHAWHDDALWVDLDGSRAVRVTPEGWTLVDEPPILFRTFAHQRPLPDPISGGDPWAVFDFLNLRDEDSRTLFKGHLVSAFIPDMPVAGLVVHGIQGSAKSTLFRVTKRLVDPSGVEVRRTAKDATELAQILFQNRVVVFDNMTSLPVWMSDALCGAITGDGWSKRALFTDEDTICFEYQRVIGIGGINLVVQRPDLLDRSVILELPPIPESEKREVTEFWTAFDHARPRILGGLLDLLSKAMAARPTVHLASLPRMADYCRWGAAVAAGEGLEPTVFSRAYARNIGRQVDAAVDASPVAQAMMALMTDRGAWEGMARELLTQLGAVAAEHQIDTRSQDWPKSANWLTSRLKEIEPCLQARGIRVITNRTRAGRTLRVERVAGNCVTCATCVTDGPEGTEHPDSGDATAAAESSRSVTDRVTQNLPPSGSPTPRDASDGNDAISGGSIDDREMYRDFEDLAEVIDINAPRQRGRAEAETAVEREAAQ
ncbi:MAG: hypothetical protein DHS20C21_00510 [Gemmatimonadota bacterium]|nr:MAG: hypothetical protein DHS20C21_00510 [Gemmatimonadota bacterium]